MKNLIIGRTNEIALLENIYNSNQPEFIAIYGRRRVGKTYLIRNFFEKKSGIFFDVMGAFKMPLVEQIKQFTSRIGEVFYNGASLKIEKNWNDTFRLLTNAIVNMKGEKKICLFFDEFPWMVTKNSRLMQSLDYYWNQYWSKDNRIKLILCGSSASWIIDNIINNKGGLHNRLTHTIALEPYNLKEVKEYLNYKGLKLSEQHIASIYMILGGIPYYLSKLQKNISIIQNIEQLAFNRKSFLLMEFENLFNSLFENAADYIDIVMAIGKTKTGINQEVLLKKVKSLSEGGRALKKLNALEDAGFIISFTPHFHKRKGIYYKIIDEYILFYLHWLEPIKSSLLLRGLKEHYWESVIDTPSWNNWAGYAFEALCYKHIPHISNALHISASAIPNAWRYQSKTGEDGAQIDLLFDRSDDAITICEIKYTEALFVIDKNYATTLLRKVEVFKKHTRTNKQLFIAMITVNGLKTTMYSEEIINGVVVLSDLFIQ